MAIRTGMQTLIDTVRGYTDAGTADWTVVTSGGTVTYWSDDEVQRALDRHKSEYIHSYLDAVQSYSGGSILYLQYRAELGNIESGTVLFKVEDASGTVTGWTLDGARGEVVFATNQAGKSFWWSGFAYDLNATAADIWRIKASHAAEFVDWATDGHNVKRSQQKDACLTMAAYYQSRSSTEGVMSVKITRDDL